MGSTTSSKIILNTVRFVLIVVLNFIFYILVAVAIMRACSMAYDFSYQIFGDVVVDEPPGTDVDFTIEENESLGSIAARLEQNRLVVNRYTFFVRARISTIGEGGKKIVPGEFNLNTSMTYTEILDTFSPAETTE